MTTIQIFFSDNSFLSIDLLNAFQRKSIQYINADLLLKNVVVENGVKILPPEYDYLYIFFFYQINFSNVPEKYADHFKNINESQEDDILEVLKENTGIASLSVPETFSFSKQMRNSIFSFLKKKKENNMLKRLFRQIRYLIDVITGFAQNRGVMLTFSGVDGAGKSTILQEDKGDAGEKIQKESSGDQGTGLPCFPYSAHGNMGKKPQSKDVLILCQEKEIIRAPYHLCCASAIIMPTIYSVNSLYIQNISFEDILYCTTGIILIS